MKYRRLIILCFALTSCASSNSKNDLNQIFSAIQNRDFNGAKARFAKREAGVTSTSYDGYDGKSYKATVTGAYQDKFSTVKWLIDNSIFNLKSCDKVIRQATAFSLKPLPEPTTNSLYSLKREISALKDNFDKKCSSTGYNGKLALRTFKTVKKAANVDLSGEVRKSEKQFSTLMAKLQKNVETQKSLIKEASELAANKEKAYKNSPEYLQKNMCFYQEQIRFSHKVIAQERSAASYSGYVDKVKMHRAGKFIEQYGILLKEAKTDYKTKFGKTWDATSCK